MSYKEMIEEIRKNFSSKQGAFTKEEMRYNTNKDTFRGCITGFMTSSYYKREKLYNQGFIYYALSFKEYREHTEKDKRIVPVWVLLSPTPKIDEDPMLLQEVKDNLDKLYDDKNLRKKYSRLFTMISENQAEPMYFEVPEEFSPDFECYLCLTQVHEDRFPLFHLGINLVIANKLVSKEVDYLPSTYWSKDYIEQY